MDAAVLRKMIDKLRQEARELDYAIRALESLAAGKPRRGRPPKIALELARKGRRPTKARRLKDPAESRTGPEGR